jgi:small-conductance mechanosensitive channel
MPYFLDIELFSYYMNNFFIHNNMTLSNFTTYISKYVNVDFKEKIVSIIVNLFFAVIIFLIFFTIGKIALNKIKYIKDDKQPSKNRKLIDLEIPIPRQDANNNFSQLYRNFIANFVFYVLILIGLIFAFTKMGFNISTFLVILGSVGIAIAFGFQNLIQEIISGILILIFRYFNLGDLVKVKGDIGYILDFNLINTTIMTNSGEVIIIPNNTITTDAFTNYTKNDEIFLIIDVSLSTNNRINYPELFQELTQQVSKSNYVIDKKKIYVSVLDMSGVGTKIGVKVKIASASFFTARSNVRLIVRQTLEEQNIKLLDNYY